MSRRHALLFCLAFLAFFFLLHYFHADRRPGAAAPASGGRGSRVADDSTGIIIYNRVPKTASTTFMHIPYELCKENGFNVLLVNNSRPQHYFSFQDTLSFAQNISRWREKRPALFHGHFAYVEFDRLGLVSPIYINLIRAPLDRLVSYYYFLRYGDDFRVNKVRSRMGDQVTFDQCVQQKLPDCDPKKLWLQIPWFCGSFKKCWEPGNRWALEQAKHNLANKYFLVGTTDELEQFIEMLELTLPRFFRGATELFRNSGTDYQHIRRTRHKEEPSERSVQIIKETRIWKMENEFYEFAASQFHTLKAELVQTGGQRLFHYEKIRPRPSST